MFFWKPKILRKKITAEQIFNILFKTFGAPKDPKIFLPGISDSYFYMAEEREILKVIEEDDTQSKKYIEEIGDCDNFAFELRQAFGRKGWPVGILYVETPFGLHAIFFYINENYEMKTVEPQDDSPFTQVNSVIGIIMY